MRYFLGLYGDLVMHGEDEEGLPDEKGDKEEIGSLAVQTYLPVVKPDGPTATCSQPWEEDGDFEALWNGDELWLEAPLHHFSGHGIARKMGYLFRNRGNPGNRPPIFSSVGPLLPGELMETRPIRTSKRHTLARTVCFENATERTVYTYTMPDGTPAEEVAESEEIEAGVNVGGGGANARRATSSSRKREATVGTSTTAPGDALCLSPGEINFTILRGHGNASVIWYTLNECTPAQLVPGQPPPFYGYDLKRLRGAHGYVVDAETGEFAKEREMATQGFKTHDPLLLVRIYYKGSICPGWYSRIHQGKLNADGIKDFVVPISVDVGGMLTSYFC